MTEPMRMAGKVLALLAGLTTAALCQHCAGLRATTRTDLTYGRCGVVEYEKNGALYSAHVCYSPAGGSAASDGGSVGEVRIGN